MNYFGKEFLKEVESRLHHRIRQLILKRWKKVKTNYKMLRKYGLNHDSAMRIASSRKKYWRLSSTHEVQRAIPTKRLHKWGLLSLTQLAETSYTRY
ncbi:reverse transcriptase [Staphylococcus aureus]|nr:reverse transcriptase [Staphylococcus aureus]